jgi:hypothetical protein
MPKPFRLPFVNLFVDPLDTDFVAATEARAPRLRDALPKRNYRSARSASIWESSALESLLPPNERLGRVRRPRTRSFFFSPSLVRWLRRYRLRQIIVRWHWQ